uniref:Uncharacterized protein n=1 Tax=Glossina palpalis gambiensis TaxID=67801 RepID=A0A1B0B9L3_9MUSC
MNLMLPLRDDLKTICIVLIVEPPTLEFTSLTTNACYLRRTVKMFTGTGATGEIGDFANGVIAAFSLQQPQPRMYVSRNAIPVPCAEEEILTFFFALKAMYVTSLISWSNHCNSLLPLSYLNARNCTAAHNYTHLQYTQS